MKRKVFFAALLTGALATLTRNNEIMGSATINNGTANITFVAPGQTGTATLTVFGYNKITYIATINITSGGGTQYNVTVSANPTNGGTVTGGGTYQQGQSCTVSATANSGFTFTNWTENGNVVSTNANYTFTVTGNRTLVANFTQQQFTITALADPTSSGTVSGGGTYNYGQSCTLTACRWARIYQLDQERTTSLDQFHLHLHRDRVGNLCSAFPVAEFCRHHDG